MENIVSFAEDYIKNMFTGNSIYAVESLVNVASKSNGTRAMRIETCYPQPGMMRYCMAIFHWEMR